MAQHSHFHLPCEYGARTDPYSRRKQTPHCNYPVDLGVGPCPEVEGYWLRCTPLGSVEEVRIDHPVERIGAVADTDLALSQVVVEGSQEPVVDSLAQHR